MSLFDLDTDISQLPGDRGVNRRYTEVPSSRDISDGNFSGSAQSFRFNVSGSTWWVPMESYFRIRVSLTKADGTPLTIEDDVAPAFCLPACLYKGAEFKIGSQTVSKVSDFLPQVEALKMRRNHSTQWREGIGNSLALCDAEFEARLQQTAGDGQGQFTFSAQESYAELGYNAVHLLTIANALLTIDQGAGPALPIAANGPGGLRLNDIIIVGEDATLQRLIITGIATDTAAQQTYNLRSVDDLQVVAVLQDQLGEPDNQFFKVSNDRLPTIQAGVLELIWKPPLSIFDHDKALPVGSYEVRLDPYQDAQMRAQVVQSLHSAKTSGIDYKFTFEQIKFYASTVESERVGDLKYYISLRDLSCQTKNIRTTAWSQQSFLVQPSTTAITVAFQSAKVGTSTLTSPTLFQVPYDDTRNAPDMRQQSQFLNRFNLTYAGQSYPTQDTEQEVTVGDLTNDVVGKKWITQPYFAAQLSNGSVWADCGGESLSEYERSGLYLTYDTPKDAKDRDTELVIKTQFDIPTVDTPPDDISQANMLVFNHYNSYAAVTIRNSVVQNVEVFQN